MTLGSIATITGIIAAVVTILVLIIKLALKLNSYFEKTDRIDKSFEGVNSRLSELEKKNYELSFNFNELNKKANNFFETKERRRTKWLKVIIKIK